MEQQDNGSFWLSKPVLGGIVALVSGIAGLFGFVVPAEVQAELVISLGLLGTGGVGIAYAVGKVRKGK